MTTSAAVLITAVVVCATLSSADPGPGMIVTVPEEMAGNYPNEVIFHLFEIKSAGQCYLSLETIINDNDYDEDDNHKANKTKEIVAEKEIYIEEDEVEKEVDFTFHEIPNQRRLTVWCNCSFYSGFTFSQQERVNIRSKRDSILIFVQTDKPIYKPGDEVRFRILVINRQLKPPGGNTKGNVSMENASGQKVAEWKNVPFSKGIVQKEFFITDEPVMGKWHIAVQVSEKHKSTPFEVRQYALPIFEVIIKKPTYVLVSAKAFVVEICARYTYGKPVKGSVRITSKLHQYWRSKEKFPIVEYKAKINGCLKYRLKVSLLDKEKKYYNRLIEINATVTEDGTGVTKNGTVEIERTGNPLRINFLDDSENHPFKPGMPYIRKVKVTKPDDTPARGEKIEICVTISRKRTLCRWWATRTVKYCRNFTTNRHGEIEFCVPPMKIDAVSLELEARSIKYSSDTSPDAPSARHRIIFNTPQSSTSAKPYYSPSKSYLQIVNDGDTLKCGTSQAIKVQYTAEKGDKHIFYYQVISKGKVVQKRSKHVTCTGEGDVVIPRCKKALSVSDTRTTLVPEDVEKGVPFYEDIDRNPKLICSTEIDIDVGTNVSPALTLLFYYIGDDNEVVADSSRFKVEECFQNKVEFRFRDKEKQPADNTSYILRASPYSLCGTKVVDKSVTLLDDSSGEIKKEEIFNALRDYEPSGYRRDHCNEDFRRGEPKATAGHKVAIFRPRRRSTSPHLDALSAFEESGRLVLSNYNLLNRICSKGEGVTESRKYFEHRKSRRDGYSGGKSEERFERDKDDEDVDHDGDDGDGGDATVSLVKMRTIFPESWLFKVESVGANGELIRRVTLPHTITQWDGYAVCINEADGLGISNKTSIKGFQAFFVSCSLPDSVIRNEKIKVFGKVSNYLPPDKCLAITLRSEIHVIVDGKVVSKTSGSKDCCLCGGDSCTHPFPVIPRKVGTLSVTMSAKNANDTSICEDKDVADIKARDKIKKTIQIGPGGFPKEKVITELIALKNGGRYNKHFSLSLPRDAIEGSGKCFVSVTGNIVGISMSNVHHLIPLPTGCGEQNIARMISNTYVMDYLTATKQDTPTLRDKISFNLRSGYQNQMNYKHRDGSYSAFGKSDNEGDMWITAITLKCFSRAKKYIYVDEKELNKTRKWIIGKQESNGCFPSTGNLFSDGIKGKENKAVTTAVVLPALKHSGYANYTVINAALKCIDRDISLTPYTASLYYLASVLTNSTRTRRYKEYLDKEKITEGNEVYWRNENGSASLDAETSGYVLLAKCKERGKGGISEIMPIVRNLTKAMNSKGGWSTSQDTAAITEAFACVAGLLGYHRVNIVLKLTAKNLKKTVTITEKNKSVVQKFEVKIPSKLGVYATGNGYALVQITTYYSTKRPPKNKFFSLSVKVTVAQSNCKMATVRICVKYLHKNLRSNMALLEVPMVTGFSPDKDSVHAVLKQSKLVKKYEVTSSLVWIYLTQVSNKQICMSFDIIENYSVEDRKDSYVKICDYYQPDETKESVKYNVPNKC